ncbi:Rab guanyl-nucleotide exchange factor [Aureococcus anophagefferens]|nr:Rab guanyl-nucleotide exchange factor [Aureococcus anophagefferens]
MSAAAPDDPFAEHDDSTASSETELVELKAVRGIDVERAGRVESVLVLEAGGASAGKALIGVEDLERFPGDPRLLAPLLSGVLKCMEPLPFVHIFAPVLPPGSSEVLEAPVPFAVGARDEDADACPTRARGCLNGAQGYAGPPADALTTVRALLERLVATVKFFHAGNVDLAVLREVRESAAFAAFEEAAGALRAADLDALTDDAAKHAFWINAHNLVVLHGCVASGPPATATAFAPVPAYLAWAKRQRYAFGELTLSAIDIEHALLRRGDIFKGTLAIALLLPRFSDDGGPGSSPRRRRALALSLFAATASSAPLRVVHARAPALQDELDANAADFLRRAAAVTKKGVTLPGPLRYNSQDLGSGTADILARLEFGAYDWAPRVDIHWDHCAEAT